MQNELGKLEILNEEEHNSLGFWDERKTVSVNQVFKIRRCYFQITEVNSTGITAKGITRKTYYEMKRGRPDWC
jgi:hypothetical protein